MPYFEPYFDPEDFKDFECSKESEFFICIAKQGIHSFMMLGVVKDGSPKLLARVGKASDMDPDFSSKMKTGLKAIGQGALARLADENYSRNEGSKAVVNYQAYSINFEQTKQFLGLIAKIDNEQHKNPKIAEGIKLVFGETERAKIQCYVPDEKPNEDKVTFKHKKISECEFLTFTGGNPSELSRGAQQIQASNTCRHTALNMVQAILGFVTDISKYFFVSPKHTTTLIAGQINKNTFYILPPPPTAVEGLSNKQVQILNKLYKRMEEIPKSHRGDPETRAKFDALKATYKEIAGKNNLNANDLLASITLHEEKNGITLFAKRNFLSKLLSLSSSTESMFKAIKKDLEKEKGKEQGQTPDLEKPSPSAS